MDISQDLYKKIAHAALFRSRILEGGRIYTALSHLGNQFTETGAQIKGTEDLFPALFISGQVSIVTYQLRRLCTVLFDTVMPYNGISYRNNVEGYEDYQDFWSFVGMPSPPHFWGSAAVVLTTKGKLLLGKKRSDRSTYGNTVTPPAGIVDTKDFVKNKIIKNALMSAGMRELSEELGIGIEEFEVLETEGFWDVQRLKPQAFVVSEVNHTYLEDFLKADLNPIEEEFENFLLIDPNNSDSLEGAQLSTEGLAAIELAKKYLG